MKKILTILFGLFIGINVHAATNDTHVETEWIKEVFYNYKKDGLIYWGQMVYIRANGEIVYCIELDKTITSDTYSSSDINDNSDINLISYFGYGYKDNNTVKDYIATQALIWESRGYNFYFTTASGGKGSIVNVDKNKERILNDIKNYDIFPKFNKSNFELLDDGIITSDISLKEYTLNSNNETITSDNTILLNTNISGHYSFELSTKYEKRGKNKMYKSGTSQALFGYGNIDNLKKLYEYNVSSGTLLVNLYDDNTKQILKNKKDNIFELYHNNNLVNTYEIDSDGKINALNLEAGNYALKQVSVSEGYVFNKEIYEFNITKGDINKNIDVYIKPITTKFNITKSYGNPKVGTKYPDNDVTFEIINKDGTKYEVTTDEFGKASITLLYGEYTVIEKKNNNVDVLKDIFEIKKSDFNGVINYDIFTPLYTARINTCLYELNTTLPIRDVTFNLLDKEYKTNDNGCFISDILNEGEYVLKETVKEGYYDIDDITVILNEDSNYYIEGEEVYIDIIVYNEKIPAPIIEEPINKDDNKNNEDDSKDNKNEDNKNDEDDKNLDNDKNEEDSNLDDASNDSNVKNDNKTNGEDKKLPYLGIYDISILYTFMLVPILKRDKKINN